MRTTLIILATIAVIITTLVYVGEDAYAHDYRTHSEWSKFQQVTWNKNYYLVRHKHVESGTVCQAVLTTGYIHRFKLVSLNGTNRSCIPNNGTRGLGAA
jgi:hypothetical protein